MRGANGKPQLASRLLVFTASTNVAADNSAIEAISLKTGERKVLVRGGYFGRFLPSTDGRAGSLIDVRDGALFGIPFDPVRLELRGTPVPLLEDVAGDSLTALGHFDVSGTGTLVYRSGKSVSGRSPMWLDGSGKMQPPLLAKLDQYVDPRLSSDSQRFAVFPLQESQTDEQSPFHITFVPNCR